MWPDFLKPWRKQNNHEWVSRFWKAGIQPTILPVLLFLLVFLTRLFVVILQKAMTGKKKKKLLCCSVPDKASFALDLCVHPCTWSFLHSSCSFSVCSLPCVPFKALASAWARGITAVAALGPCLCPPAGSACCAESPGTPTAMDPALDSPLFTSLLSGASLYPVFSKASAGLDYLWISCSW